LNRDIWAALPVKSLSQAKRRLMTCLSPADRRVLVLAMLQTTTESIVPFVAANQIVVVSPDPQVLNWAAERGLCPQQQSGRGLNNAIHQVERDVMRAGGDVFLVVLPDLPLLTPVDVEQLLRRLDSAHQVVLGVGQRGGTHALAIRPPGWLRFAFGPRSYECHVTKVLADGGTVVRYGSPGLSFDVDSADDLRFALQMRPELLR
jgi:2-phospho-L-lactate/phosphoenolpyruvate guanylyltransferase